MTGDWPAPGPERVGLISKDQEIVHRVMRVDSPIFRLAWGIFRGDVVDLICPWETEEMLLDGLRIG